MSRLVLADVVRGIRDLPSLPNVVIELLNIFDRTDASTGALANKVAQDQALAAKTLRLANSSFYGLQWKITTIQQAITVLGFDSVKTFVIAAGVIGNLPGGAQEDAGLAKFWRHAIGTALCAKGLARALNLNRDHAFISGLLHDIGKLVLVSRYPDQYAKVIAYRSEHDCTLLDAERKVLIVDHAVVGQALAEYWRFPIVIQKSIGSHHAPMPDESGGIPGVIHIADAVAHGLDLTGCEDDLVPVVMDDAWNRLNLGPAMLRTVFRNAEAEFEDVCRILGA
jgi:putative nucleotidyltransferase with HDIG domain